MSTELQRSDDLPEFNDQIQYGNSSNTLGKLSSEFKGRPHNHSQTPPFYVLISKLFNPLINIRKRPDEKLPKKRPYGSKSLSPNEQRDVIIQRFISWWRTSVGNDFFPALRLILPDKDRDRLVYSLKEKAAAKLIIRVLRLDRHSRDALRLLNWTLPHQRIKSNVSRDFADTCYEIFSRRAMRNEPGDLRIAEVNRLLDQLSLASEDNGRLRIFERLYQQMNAEEMMWLIRIVLHKVRIGVSQKSILNLWHPDGDAIFNMSSSLKRVCWELSNASIRLKNEMIGATIMEPFQPQLAQFHMHQFENLIMKLGCTSDDEEFWIEEKLDGERMQLHMMEDQLVPGGFRFSFWSRKGKDYTYLYGHGFEDNNSSLTRFIRGAFNENIRNIILDGEMITWNSEINKMVSFGSLKSAALSQQQNPHAGTSNRPVYRVFDCLYVNNRRITQFILKERRQVLERAINSISQRIEIHPFTPAKRIDQIEEELQKVIDRESEGLVLKNPRSMYRLNCRNYDWIKVKPEYMTGFGESLDCIVIGGYFGQGIRAGTLASFLCGLRVDNNHVDVGSNPMKCYSFFRVGVGFSTSDYLSIRRQTDGKWKNWDQKAPPSDIIVLGDGKGQSNRPDQWINPQDSVVLEVKAASFGASRSFGAGFTLRFPRFKRLRHDKSWKDALSINEFLELRNRTDSRAQEVGFFVEPKKKASNRAKREITIAGNDADFKTKYTSYKTNVFEGLKFCVMSEMLEPWRETKANIEQVIKINGGNIFQNPTSQEKTICISDKRVVRVASLMRAKQNDIIKPVWIFDVLRQAEIDGLLTRRFLLPFEPRHIFYATQVMQESIKNSVDAYGDSYTRDVTVDELKKITAEMTLSSNPRLLDNDILKHFEKYERII